MSRYANKRPHLRTGGGKFRRAVASDLGLGGWCEKCHHLLLRHYDGDPREPFIDPRKFGYRCFTCQPLTEAEQALAAEIEASRPKPVSLLDLLNRTTGS